MKPRYSVNLSRIFFESILVLSGLASIVDVPHGRHA
jgi:hypothetical protein